MTLEDIVGRAKFTVLIGKNGAGKSTLLRALDSKSGFSTKYITPERGGVLKPNANIDSSMESDPLWLVRDRRKNRTEHFRHQSASHIRALEVLVLREIEKDPHKRRDVSYSFDSTLARINKLLPALELRREDRGFSLASRSGIQVAEDQISSGEAELIALAIEVLVFSRESHPNKLLLMDEPDVHLHPDLQHKFVAFIEEVATEFDFRVALATHSTAVIGAFSSAADMQIVPVVEPTQSSFEPFRSSDISNAILPIFGAHPLSSHFNSIPVVLVEGDDDRRVIEQAVRSSGGRIALNVCPVGTVSEMTRWETWLSTFLPTLYDTAKAYSLRDLDDSPQCAIDNLGCVLRCRLNCYAIENLLLTNECLRIHSHTPQQFRQKLEDWPARHPDHQASPDVASLARSFDHRRTTKIKSVRNVIVALLDTQKPWEVVVGQLIAQQLGGSDGSEHSIRSYLGPHVCSRLFGV